MTQYWHQTYTLRDVLDTTLLDNYKCTDGVAQTLPFSFCVEHHQLAVLQRLHIEVESGV